MSLSPASHLNRFATELWLSQAFVHARRALATAKVRCNSDTSGSAMGCTEEMEETE